MPPNKTTFAPSVFGSVHRPTVQHYPQSGIRGDSPDGLSSLNTRWLPRTRPLPACLKEHEDWLEDQGQTQLARLLLVRMSKTAVRVHLCLLQANKCSFIFVHDTDYFNWVSNALFVYIVFISDVVEGVVIFHSRQIICLLNGTIWCHSYSKNPLWCLNWSIDQFREFENEFKDIFILLQKYLHVKYTST